MAANRHKGEIELAGLGVIRFDYDAIARLVDTYGPEFDKVISEGIAATDVDVFTHVLAIGSGKTLAEVKGISPPLVPASNAIFEALSLAFHGQRKAPPAEPGDENPT